jgi:hypothetical protein
MDNRFLSQFLKSRHALANDSASKPSRSAEPAAKKPKMSVATIIEDKPHKSKVLEYFRERIQEIEDSDVD